MPCYSLGLDIGQHRDRASLAIVEVLLRGTAAANPVDDTFEPVYRIVYLHEWPLGTIPQTVLADLSDRIHLAQGRFAMARISYDATGIGASWLDLITSHHRAGKLTKLWPRPYTISGEQVPSSGLSVRKIDLMSLIQRLGNEGRLELDPDLHLADRFTTQLQAISAKPTAAGRLTFAAPQAVHDDLVSAVSLALHDRPRGDAEPRRFGTVPAPALNPFAASVSAWSLRRTAPNEPMSVQCGRRLGR